MKIIQGNLGDPRIIALLQLHVTTSAAQTEPGSAHALDVGGLRSPEIEFWAAWDGEELLGFAALKERSPDHGEIKSMHVAQSQRRRGAGRALLEHLIARAQGKGMRKLSLETGSWDYFHPAQALYRRHGFVECAPFGDYQPDRNSVFMTLELYETAPSSGRMEPNDSTIMPR
jgi:putative acetyltransferase